MRPTDIETDRQTDQQTMINRERKSMTLTDKIKISKESKSLEFRQAERQIDRQTDSKLNRQIERQTNRQPDRLIK